MPGTATEIEMCGRTIRLGDKMVVEYSTGTWSKGGQIEGTVTELWAMDTDNHLQARLSCRWCFHDGDRVLHHNGEKIV